MEQGVLKSIFRSRNTLVFLYLSLGAYFIGLLIQLLQSGGDISYFLIFSNWSKNWLELTLAGITMGFLIFILASGMTLIFGLIGVINLAHGAFIAFGSFICWHFILKVNKLTEVVETVYWTPVPGVIPPVEKTVVATKGMFYGASWPTSVALLVAGLAFAAAALAFAGWFYEKFVISKVYGDQPAQILLTLGVAVVMIEILMVFYGGSTPRVWKPWFLRGQLTLFESWDSGVGILYSRLLAGGVGLFIFIFTHLLLIKTRFGLLVRAGVENKEMVEAFGYKVKTIFLLVFVMANIYAAIGGSLYSLNNRSVSLAVSDDLLLVVMVAVIIGGLGSIKGCLIGSVLLMLAQNYMNGIYPPLAGGMSAVLVMIVILLWRPEGLNPVGENHND